MLAELIFTAAFGATIAAAVYVVRRRARVRSSAEPNSTPAQPIADFPSPPIGVNTDLGGDITTGMDWDALSKSEGSVRKP